MIVELFLPGFGIAGISGMGALALSIYLVLRETSILFWQEVVYQLFFMLPYGEVWSSCFSSPKSSMARLGLKKERTGKVYQIEEKALNPR